MTQLTAAEAEYLNSQRLGRIATIGPDGAPQARPVGFMYNSELSTIDIGGRNMVASRKYRNLLADPRTSFIVDDLASISPWTPRGIEIRGRAELLPDAILRPGFPPGLIRIHTDRVFSWGL
jgi:pyridoxamine 5'-phosphate oxidase family protein